MNHSFFLFLLLLCAPSNLFSAQKKIRLSGASIAVPIVQQASQGFLKTHKKTKFQIQSNDSLTALEDLANGQIDGALVSIDIPKDFQQRHSSITFVSQPLARDAVVPVVSQMVYISGVKDLSLRDLKDILTGKIKNWKELKGPNGNIVVVLQKPTSGTYQVFINAIFGDDIPQLREDIHIYSNDNDCQKAVMKSTAAITALPMTWTKMEARGCGIKTKKGILYPTTDTIMRNTYPMAHGLFVVTKGEPTGDLKSFFSYLKGPETRGIIKDLRLIPLW